MVLHTWVDISWVKGDQSAAHTAKALILLALLVQKGAEFTCFTGTNSLPHTQRRLLQTSLRLITTHILLTTYTRSAGSLRQVWCYLLHMYCISYHIRVCVCCGACVCVFRVKIWDVAKAHALVLQKLVGAARHALVVLHQLTSIYTHIYTYRYKHIYIHIYIYNYFVLQHAIVVLHQLTSIHTHTHTHTHTTSWSCDMLYLCNINLLPYIYIYT